MENRKPRDYYDICILERTQDYDKRLFEEALSETALHEGTSEPIKDRKGIIEKIENDQELQNARKKYQQKFPYASSINYEDTIDVLNDLLL